MRTIQEAVAEKISKAGENVQAVVVDKLADVEIQRRIGVITEAVGRFETLEKEFKKINRNDIETYVDGKKAESMSKQRFEEINKTKQKLETLEKATNSALSENTPDSYNKLSETLKKLSGNSKESSPESAG